MSSEYGSDIDLNASDLAAIDLLCARSYASSAHGDGAAPRTDFQSPLRDGSPQEEGLSLFERFRRNSLYVTDWCAPAYCEVKYHYGLVGRRDLKPEVSAQNF